MMKKRAYAALTAAALLCSTLPVLPAVAVSAAEIAYPAQYFRLGMADTDANVTASGTSLVPSAIKGTAAEKWSLNWVSDGVFEIVNAADGLLLTAEGSGVALEQDTDGENQRWEIKGVEQDFDGYDLYYRVTSTNGTSLTYTENAGFSLSDYAGDTYQQFRLDLDGLEGWAANADTSAGVKAGTIGGLLGEVVYVDNADDLEKQLNTDKTQTIVITSDIDMQKKGNTRVRDNKTIVGCYGSHTIYDSQFRTNDAYGAEDDSPSDNIIFRNLKMVAKNAPNRILINIWSSRQIWIDHIYFESQLTYDRTGDGQDEVGKFIWINTPYDNYMDAKDRLRSPDYVTISYCHLKNRYWTVAYGTQNDELTRDRTTLLYNWWDENVRRCPQLGNGSAHIYNNYYSAYGTGANGAATSGIIGGDGSDMVSENNYFNGYSMQQAFMMGGGKEPCRDAGSYLSEGLDAVPAAVKFTPQTTSSWYPNKTNYGYSLLDAYNTKNTDTKAFCTAYSGDQTKADGMKYITDAEFASWITTAYPSPFLRHVDFSAVVPAVFTSGSVYRLKNVNSGLYMQVEGAAAENGTNVQQWGTADGVTHDLWKLFDEGEGFYSLISAVGDGGTYALDIAGKKTTDGTNADIYQYNGGDNQKFMLTANPDGSYKLRTKITGGKSAVEIADAGMGSGDNVQQWTINGNACQDWILEKADDPGCRMDTGLAYEFENANSGMVMDITGGEMAESTNVQQWTTGHFASQKWKLEAFSGGGNYYYIRSMADENYVLKAMSGENGGNIAIVPYSAKDSAMLFKFSKNLDGSYLIRTRASRDAAVIEIANAGTGSGDNVQQWEPNGNACQKWVLNTEELPKIIKGDVNADGIFNVADVVLLQKWLLAVPETHLADWEAADVCEDEKLDVFDLAMMKRILLN